MFFNPIHTHEEGVVQDVYNKEWESLVLLEVSLPQPLHSQGFMENSYTAEIVFFPSLLGLLESKQLRLTSFTSCHQIILPPKYANKAHCFQIICSFLFSLSFVHPIFALVP